MRNQDLQLYLSISPTLDRKAEVKYLAHSQVTWLESGSAESNPRLILSTTPRQQLRFLGNRDEAVENFCL